MNNIISKQNYKNIFQILIYTALIIYLCISIFNSVGKAIIIDESKMQSATVMCASGIAFWMRIIRAMAQGGVELGFEAKDSLEISYRTAQGAISLLEKNKTHPEE